MTNKPMLSVERELLERAINLASVFDDGSDGADAESSRSVVGILRALLDKPAESVIDLDALDWESVKEAAAESKWMPPEYMRNEWVVDVCEFLRAEPAAQHQGDPVAWVHPAYLKPGALGFDASVCRLSTLQVPLYTEQPAPVAVVMPERMVDTRNDSRDDRIYDNGWNACLEEVSRLNGVKL